MRRRQPLPRLWMMTDERQGEDLWQALDRLPRGTGVVFRHYGLQPAKRRLLFEKVRKIARRKGLLLLLAGSSRQAAAWGADGCHGRANGRRSNGLVSASAHNLREIRAGERRGADFIFVSPLFETRSHPGAKALGPLRFARLARETRLPVIALGGVSPTRARRLQGMACHGWAAIDAWATV